MKGMKALKQQEKQQAANLKAIQVDDGSAEASPAYTSEEGGVYGPMSSGRNEFLGIKDQLRKHSDDKKTGSLTSCADTNFSTSKKQLATYEELKNKYLNFGLPDENQTESKDGKDVDDVDL